MRNNNSDSIPPLRGKGRRGGAKSARVYKPGLVTIAIVMFWAAYNEPAMFDSAGILIWLLGAVTVGLLVRAGLALFEPMLRLAVRMAMLGLAHVRDGVSEP